MWWSHSLWIRRSRVIVNNEKERPYRGALLLLCVIIATFNCELVDKQIIKSII